MKKRIISKMFAITMATTIMFGSTLIVHAENWDDGVYHGDGNGASGDSGLELVDIGGGSSDSGSSSSSDSGSSYSEPSYSYDSSSSNSGSSDSGSSDSGSSSGSSSTSYSAPAPKAAGSTTSVTGKETFRALAKAGSGTYKITHKGVDIATFTLMDVESKKAVPCTAVTLKQRSDGKWAINFQVTVSNAETTEMADTTNLTIGAPLDRTYIYKTLGVNYVTINDEIVINIEAEASAK